MKRNDEPATVGDVRALGEVFDTLTVAAAKLEDRLGALEKRMDVLVYARSAVPYDFPASDVRAGMAPAGFTVATTPPADEPPAPVPWDGILWGQIRDWSKATFGPGRRTKGLLEHIRRELDEVAAAPDDLVEWVDVVLLAFDGYWRHGGTPEGFVFSMKRPRSN